MMRAPPAPKKRRQKARANSGRKPGVENIRVCFVGPRGEKVRFALSEDIVERLKKAHDAAFGVVYQVGSLRLYHAGYDPYAHIRIEFMRFEDMGIPGVFIRIEPPTYEPKGHRIWRAKNGRRFYVEVRCSEVGVRAGQAPISCEYLFDDNQPRVLGGGMMLVFPDEYMAFRGPKNRETFETANIYGPRDDLL